MATFLGSIGATRPYLKYFLFVALAISGSALFGSSYIVPPDDVLTGKAEAIVIARATATWIEDTTEHGIETVTEFTVEDTLKGIAPQTFRVRMPGGHFGKLFKIVPGTPHFEIGAAELLFVNRRPDGEDYTTTDFALGRFRLKYDDTGRRLALRDEGEIHGWDLNTNAVHRERRRVAEKFIDYIRAISSGRPAEPDYFIPPDRSLHLQPNALRPVTLACSFPACTGTQYTLSFYQIGSPPCNSGIPATDQSCAENGPAGRWAVFPSQVNWNKGNSETGGAPNGGTDAINAAFGSWNGDANSNINYALASTAANSNGIFEAPDGVNNIVFEKALGTPYSCSGGGLLGQGGVQTAGPTMSTVNGEMFFNNVETDVSMNAGVGACVGAMPGIPVGDFNSAVTHEFGHTLDLRHADRSRANDVVCTTYSTYDCSSSAIMTASVTFGLNATLQTWEQHAVQTLYPPAAPPAVTGVEAHSTSGTSVLVSWTGACATTCHIYRSKFNDKTTFDGPFSGVSPFNDSGGALAAGRAYLYKVRNFNGTTESADSNIDMANTVVYSNTITAGAIVQVADINQTRDVVDAVRTLDGIGPGSYSFGSGSPSRIVGSGTTVIHALDINEARTNLNTAMNGLFGMSPGYTNTITASSSVIMAIDFNDFRNITK
ncbi:MAG: hypothetical protein DMF59_13800 [Acidobacteria bacterium]|nr:MAG: hypothetical protein DMF59_13800 [Acidobacteriota bacterium]